MSQSGQDSTFRRIMAGVMAAQGARPERLAYIWDVLQHSFVGCLLGLFMAAYVYFFQDQRFIPFFLHCLQGLFYDPRLFLDLAYQAFLLYNLDDSVLSPDILDSAEFSLLTEYGKIFSTYAILAFYITAMRLSRKLFGFFVWAIWLAGKHSFQAVFTPLFTIGSWWNIPPFWIVISVLSLFYQFGPRDLINKGIKYGYIAVPFLLVRTLGEIFNTVSWVMRSAIIRLPLEASRVLVRAIPQRPIIPKLDSPLDQFDHSKLYKYSKLSNREIRLLRIERRKPFSPVRCSLVRVSLDHPPVYEAMSYVWGDAMRTHVVEVDGALMPITESVCQILELKASIWMRKLLWIDLVCINQNNSDEKSNQVQMMLEIYQKAGHVTIYLGIAEDAHLVPIFLAELWARLRLQSEEIIGNIWKQELQKTGGKQPDRWLALFHLLQSPWFERVWVVQELAVASSVRVVYGRRYLSYDMLAQVIAEICASRSGHLRNAVCTLGDGHLAALPTGLSIAPLTMSYRRRFQEGEKLKLYDTLRALSDLRATEGQDKIFALLALTEAAVHPLLKIDYKIPVSQVVINTAQYLMNTKDALHVLQLAGIGWHHHGSDLPSWVVNWASSITALTFALAPMEDAEEIYHAATSAPLRLQCNPGEKYIKIDGLMIDTISKVNDPLKLRDEKWSPLSNSEQPFFTDSLHPAWTKYIHDAEQAMSEHACDPYPTGQGHSEVLWRTLTGDLNPDTSRPAEKSRALGFEAYREVMYSRQLRHGNSDTSLEQRIEAGFLFANAFGGMAKARAFAVTGNGYVGLVPPGTKQGDVLVLFFGAPVPFILRRRALESVSASEEISVADLSLGGEVGHNYILVGDSYVHGVMDGEMLSASSEKAAFTIW